MHILFLTDNFVPEVNAPASRTYEHCKQWVISGAQVTVITGVPNFPQGVVFKGYRNKLWQQETVDGIRVIRVWTYITANEGLVKRILDYLSFMISGTLASLFIKKVDVVVGTSPQFFTACAAFLIAKYKGVPWLFELRDIWPESIRAVGALSNRWILGTLESIEMFLYKRADRIVVVSPAFKNILVARGVAGGKIATVLNGVDLSRFNAMSKDLSLAEQLGISKKFVIGYVGTLGLAHGLETLVEAAELVQQREPTSDILFLFLGSGARKAQLTELATSKGLRNVLFLESVPKEQVVRYWSLLDATIIHLRKVELFNSVIPSKMFEAMAMGIPIAHGVPGVSADIVEAEGIGELFPCGDAVQLCELALRWSANPKALELYRFRGPSAAMQYDRKHLALKLFELISEVINHGPAVTE